MESFTIYESVTLTPPRIVVLGIGNSGQNIVEYMRHNKTLEIEYIVPNSYEQDHYRELYQMLAGVDIVYIVLGLGGTSGGLAASNIAKIAKETGALTIAVATKPFNFEGPKRRKIADSCLIEIKKICDSVVVIPCDKLLQILDPKLEIHEIFKIVDSIVARTINGISGVILSSGDNDINLDILDLRTIMSKTGIAVMGIGENQGNNAAYEAMTSAINMMMTDDISIKNASGILVHFTLHPEFDFMKLSTAMDIIHSNIDESADVIFGTTTDENIPIDFIRITIVATGFEKVLMVPVNNVF